MKFINLLKFIGSCALFKPALRQHIYQGNPFIRCSRNLQSRAQLQSLGCRLAPLMTLSVQSATDLLTLLVWDHFVQAAMPVRPLELHLELGSIQF